MPLFNPAYFSRIIIQWDENVGAWLFCST